MLFHSLEFLIFFPVVTLLYFLIPSKFRYLWLLFASYFFYMSQEPSYALFLILATVITWISGGLIYKVQSNVTKKLIVAIGFILTLSFLIYFKYSDFLLSLIGSKTRLNLMLPLGISFYTFQSLSYIMDCYRKETAPEKNFFRYALFVSFFPNILSGPIERSKHMLCQIREEHSFQPVQAKNGLLQMLWGYFLKLVVVSRLTILTDLVFDNYASYSGTAIIIAVLGYAFQIYCDFAGYSCIAIGSAKIMGFHIMQNFRQPYLSTSIADFWRHWHISLSSWFRDYLYFPLGGSRCSKLRKYCNVMIIFLTSGIWHGANLTFLVWGALNGFYQIIGDLCKPLKMAVCNLFKLHAHPRLHNAIQICITFFLLSVTWIFFRAPSLADALAILHRIALTSRAVDLINGTVFSLGLGTFNLLFVLSALCIVVICDLLCKKKDCDITDLFSKVPLLLRWSIYYALITMILLSCNLSTQEFLYMQF